MKPTTSELLAAIEAEFGDAAMHAFWKRFRGCTISIAPRRPPVRLLWTHREDIAGFLIRRFGHALVYIEKCVFATARQHAEEIVRRYTAGEPTANIARHYGLDTRTIYTILYSQGVPRTRKNTWVHDPAIRKRNDDIVQGRKDGMTARELSAMYGTPLRNVYRILRLWKKS